LRLKNAYAVLIMAVAFSGNVAAHAKTVETNQVRVYQAPAWLYPRQVAKSADKAEDFMEWSIKRVDAFYHQSESSFSDANPPGKLAIAFSRQSDQTIHLSPRVDRKNFSSILTHELVHITVYQKYKDSIPVWLNEGLANSVAKNGRVDYSVLSRINRISVTSLGHPFSETGKVSVSDQYQVSTALMEMISKKCDIHDLLQMSVKKKLQDYLDNLCGIGDLNAEFWKWVDFKANQHKKLEKLKEKNLNA